MVRRKRRRSDELHRSGSADVGAARRRVGGGCGARRFGAHRRLRGVCAGVPGAEPDGALRARERRHADRPGDPGRRVRRLRAGDRRRVVREEPGGSGDAISGAEGDAGGKEWAMKTDAIVIGGGVAGLATGALLAKQGKRVTVLEKGNQPGGRAYTYEDKGFTLNYGPHAMYRPNSGILGDVLRRLERPLIEHGLPDPEEAYWAIGERFGYIGAKPQQVLTTGLFPVKSRLQVMKLMAAIKFAKPEQVGEQTMRTWVERQTKDELVRRFALALTTVNTYTRPAGELSARFVLRHMQRN